jgi:hypothetical protein
MKAPVDFFTNLDDPRVDRTKEHLLEDIIFIPNRNTVNTVQII